MVKYIVPVGSAEHLFKEDELDKAKELAIAAKSKVIMEGKVWKIQNKQFVTVRREVFAGQ